MPLCVIIHSLASSRQSKTSENCSHFYLETWSQSSWFTLFLSQLRCLPLVEISRTLPCTRLRFKILLGNRSPSSWRASPYSPCLQTFPLSPSLCETVSRAPGLHDFSRCRYLCICALTRFVSDIIMLFKSIMGEDRVRASPVLRPGRERLADVIFTSVAVIPALCIAFGTSNVSFLVKITGSFPGLSIMFIAPSLMVFFARRRASKELDPDESNPHRSPFSSVFWIIAVWVFSAAAIGLISYNLLTGAAGESSSDFCAAPSHNNTLSPLAAPLALVAPTAESTPVASISPEAAPFISAPTVSPPSA